MLAAVLVGYLIWCILRWLSRRFEQKAFSDTQLLVDSWWLIVILQQTGYIAVDFGWGALAAGLLAFVAYRAVIALGLAIWPTADPASKGGRLLLLRVFGFRRRSERLFDVIAQRWRLRGSVRLIAGADLAMRILDPADFIAFVGGRMQHLFVGSTGENDPRFERLDEARDPDGRFRIAKFYCYENTWRPTLSELLRRSDAVLDGSAGVSGANSGCEFELRQLAASGLLPRTVFVTDDITDVGLLETLAMIKPASLARCPSTSSESRCTGGWRRNLHKTLRTRARSAGGRKERTQRVARAAISVSGRVSYSLLSQPPTPTAPSWMCSLGLL